MSELPGIDVSSFQGQPDWSLAAPVNWFANVKATEGVGLEDPEWAYNAGAMPSSLVRGAYHFARPDLGNAAQAEADYFWSRVVARVADLRGWLLVLDLERGSGDLSGWRDAFCGRISQLAGGYVPGWYSFWNFILDHNLNKPTNYWSWLAWPDSNGPFPPVQFLVSFQQYGQGPVPGIVGDVDLDRFFGDPAALRAYTVGGGFHLDYSLKLALVGLMYFSVLGRGPHDQPEADQWATQIGDQGQNAWQILETIAASAEAQKYATPAGRIAALEALVKTFTVPSHNHPVSLTGTTGAPQ